MASPSRLSKVSTATWSPVSFSKAASLVSIRCFWSAVSRFAWSTMRPVRGGMSLAEAKEEKRTTRTARTAGTEKDRIRRVISVLLPPQLVAQLVAVARPDLDVVPREHLAALPDGFHQSGPRPAVPDLRGEPPG